MAKDYPKDLKICEVWVENYKPGELSKKNQAPATASVSSKSTGSSAQVDD